MSEVEMNKSAEVLALFLYIRDNDGQVKQATAKDCPVVKSRKYGGAEHKCDAANNPTTVGATTQTFNEADELEKAGTNSYSYDDLGERVKTTPEKGPATNYSYDQAGNPTSVERSKEGETFEIRDTYAYGDEDLRTSQAISGTTSYLAWDMAEELPLILGDRTNSYIYGPGTPLRCCVYGLRETTIEQINNSTGSVTYLHHDQAGSTRLITGSTGNAEGAYSYSAYGTPEHTGTATTPLGYDGQYPNTDTGLSDMRARVYDPATAQFLSVDPLVGTTWAPYNYASDNPVNHSDPSGLCDAEFWTSSFWTEGNCVSESSLNPVKYYEQEIESYEDGCGYFASVEHGLEGAVVGALDVTGAGEEGAAAEEGISISAKIARQMEARGWTEEQIQEAIGSGEQVQAVNKATGNPATRYINPETGQSVVLDDVTKEVIHVGGPGFLYGPGSGDLP